MKKYFIVSGQFANQYSLFWTTDAGYYPGAASYQRKFNTIAYARAERKRRKENEAFSGYADCYVHPYGAAWYDPTYAYLHTDSTGVIVE